MKIDFILTNGLFEVLYHDLFFKRSLFQPFFFNIEIKKRFTLYMFFVSILFHQQILINNSIQVSSSDC